MVKFMIKENVLSGLEMLQENNRSSNQLKVFSTPAFKRITKTDLPKLRIDFREIKPIKIKLPK
jgi:hypothetical protein